MASDATGTARSTRDLDQARASLEGWLTGKLPPGSSPRVSRLSVPPTVGQSSDTVIFEVSWQGGGGTEARRLVARVAPQQADIPLFPGYDLARDYHAMRGVAELTDAHVPEAVWLEPDPSYLGSPFLVMSHVEGEVPSDVLYILDGWLAQASAGQRRGLQDSTISELACLHAVPEAAGHFPFLQFPEAGDTPLRRHVAHAWAWYEYARARGGRFPLIEQGFRWVQDHWPAHDGETCLLWGDARIGNVLYRDFRPAALLDWEMAALGPREADVAWLVASHRVFEDMLTSRGLPGLPGFLRLDDVAATYEAASGHALRDMDFYLTYAAVQWATIFVLTGLRRVHFGQLARPDDSQELITNRAVLARLLAGGPWVPAGE